jgi:hypothetical protein
MKIQLVQTCGACPEQYDAYLNNEKIGYLRLRNGSFRAEYKGQTVYHCHPNGDGMFEHDERDRHLNGACAAILKAHEECDSDLYEIIPEEPE